MAYNTYYKRAIQQKQRVAKTPELLVPNRKPNRNFKLNLDNTYAKHLVLGSVFNEGSGDVQDLAHPSRRFARSGDTTIPTWTTNSSGTTLEASTVNRQWLDVDPNYTINTNEFTIIFIGVLLDLGKYNVVWRSAEGGGASFFLAEGSDFPWIQVNGEEILRSAPGPGDKFELGRLETAGAFSGVSRLGICQIDVNGNQSYTTSHAVDSGDSLLFSTLGKGTLPSRWLTAQYEVYYVFDKYFSFEDRQRIIDNPYALLKES